MVNFHLQQPIDHELNEFQHQYQKTYIGIQQKLKTGELLESLTKKLDQPTKNLVFNLFNKKGEVLLIQFQLAGNLQLKEQARQLFQLTLNKKMLLVIESFDKVDV